MKAILIAQIGWIFQIAFDFPLAISMLLAAVLVLIEMAGPVIAERVMGGTPWHPHHIAERYALFAIIALGEGVVGAAVTLSAVVELQGWSLDAALVGLACTGLTFGMWWVYYMLPSAQVLHAHRERSFGWGYTQVLVITSIVATGAGLHAAAYFIEGEAKVGPLLIVLSVAVPVGIFLGLIYAVYYYLVRRFDTLHIWLLSGTAIVVALAILAVLSRVSMPLCLVILMLAPAVTVVGYEIRGHRHQAEALARDSDPVLD